MSQYSHELVVLGTQCRMHAQYIQVVRSISATRSIKRGTLAPLTRTAVGWTLVSKLPDRDVIRLCMRVNAEEDNAATRVSPSWFVERIQEVREVGYAFCYGRVTPEVGAISKAVPASAGQPPLVVAVSGSGSRFVERKADIAEAMHECIDRYAKKAVGPSLPTFN